MTETRQITQTKIWLLILNRMTDNTEGCSLVAVSDDRDKLLNWYNSERASEPYYSTGTNSFPAKGDFPASYNGEHKYYKVFKLSSPLEWFNPMKDENQPDHWGHGIKSEWVNEDSLEGVKTNNNFI